MEAYCDRVYSITLTGLLVGKPSLYQIQHDQKRIEFFVQNLSNEQYLHRVFAYNEEAEKIYNLPSGIKLFLDGEIIHYTIALREKKSQIIPEVVAKKIWLLNSAGSGCSKPHFSKKNLSSIKSASNQYALH